MGLTCLALLGTGVTGCGDSAGGTGDSSVVALPPGMLPPPRTNADAAPPAVPFSAATPNMKLSATASWPHDTLAYTQGLVVTGTRLLESTGIEGRSDVREVQRTTGATVQRTPLPARQFGEGIALAGDRVYQLTWRGGQGHVYDAATLARVDSFTYSGEGWGLASDGTRLFLSDGTSRVRVIDPSGFRETRTINVTEAGRAVPMLNELEMVRGELWANVYQTDLIARIDTASGAVTGWVDVSGLLSVRERADVMRRGGVANGIAYDAKRGVLLLTGKLWPKLFEVSANDVFGAKGR
ncbi:MAG TPA: glutaminyl-peptide cyclotransferase [Gemmatimonas sp.]|nr:glutaminyl-peptide cyclotransferase [Gemmatimonas sp.]